jgi:SPP1 gp7 family putative phage head morphogenesis protein
MDQGNRVAVPLMAVSQFSTKDLSHADTVGSLQNVDLLYAIGLPPEQAIEYFKAKGFAYSWNWQDLWQSAQAQAFTVAKAMRLDVLQTIRDELQLALDEGRTFAEFKKNLEPKLKEMGWWGKHEIVDADGVVSSVQLGSPYRLKTIYRTNLQTSMMAGRYREMMESMDVAPYGQYVSVLDGKTRPAHRALHGLVFRLDDPFWNTHWPPNGWGCRCRVRQLTQRDVDRKGLTVSTGDGKLSDETVLSGGKDVTVTVFSQGNLRMAPDAGWNYNPGAVGWKPDPARYDKDIAAL